MARTKIPYTKQAKSLDEQITILRSRNVMIKDEEKAKEYLSDIGYYRLGFYSFPFDNDSLKIYNYINFNYLRIQ